MRKLLIIAALAVLPISAQAQFTLGARVGYGLGMGDVGGTLAMSDWVKSQIPVQLDALYRVSPNLSLGGYFSYGFGQTGDACDYAGADCSAKVTRLGAQLTYGFTGQQMLPWVGAGIGYEWNTIEESGTTATFTGFEFLNLQGGADFKVNEQFSAGPYVMFTLSQYDSGEVAGISGDITDKGMHNWLSFGVRGKFDL